MRAAARQVRYKSELLDGTELRTERSYAGGANTVIARLYQA